jgi:hypothetical protein
MPAYRIPQRLFDCHLKGKSERGLPAKGWANRDRNKIEGLNFAVDDDCDLWTDVTGHRLLNLISSVSVALL